MKVASGPRAARGLAEREHQHRLDRGQRHVQRGERGAEDAWQFHRVHARVGDAPAVQGLCRQLRAAQARP